MFSDSATESSLFRNGMTQLNLYGTPIIAVVGILTNTLSILVFTTSKMRHQSSSVYLISMAISDNGFLLSLFITWLSWVDVYLFHKPIWCQTLVFTTYICSFLSTWNVCSFTVERFIAVIYPLKRIIVCTVHRALTVVVLEAVLAVLLYSFSIWTSTVYQFPDHSVCATKQRFIPFVQLMMNVDTVITLIIPSILIIVLNIRIAMTLYYLKRDRRYLTETQLFLSNTSTSTSKTRTQRAQRTSRTNSPNIHLRASGMLLAVSTTFVLLNIPSHAFRIYGFLQDLKIHSYNLSPEAQLWQELFQFLYYLNFSTNFFLYVAFRKAFRVEVLLLACRCRWHMCKVFNTCRESVCRKAENQIYVTKSNSSRRSTRTRRSSLPGGARYI